MVEDTVIGTASTHNQKDASKQGYQEGALENNRAS